MSDLEHSTSFMNTFFEEDEHALDLIHKTFLRFQCICDSGGNNYLSLSSSKWYNYFSDVSDSNCVMVIVYYTEEGQAKKQVKT